MSKKLTNMANPKTDPRRDILIRSNFDFINNTNSKTTVVFKPAIFAALIGQKGFINTICWSWLPYHLLILAKTRAHRDVARDTAT